MRLLVVTILVCAAGLLLVEVAMVRATKAHRERQGRPAVRDGEAPDAGGRSVFVLREPGDSPEDVLIRIYRGASGPDARIRVIQALGRIPTESARRFLEEAAREDPAGIVRSAARRELAGSRGEESGGADPGR